ncbi:HK97-gp10 family putative phage morphogenesis protein [Pseudomonas tolaasii]
MADTISYKLKGADNLSRIFKTLPQELQRQVVLPAAKDAMDIVLKDAISRAQNLDDPATFPDISKNIALIEDKKFFEETGNTKVSVGVRKRKRGVGGGNTYYWWYLELGTSHIRARPFMRNALGQNQQAVFQEFISSAKFQLLKLDLS